jgi:Predicted transporter component
LVEETMVTALAGGLLIGLGAVLLMLANGRIAGISGIVGGLADQAPGETSWRLAFLAGLVLGPLVVAAFTGALPAVHVDASGPVVVAAGLLVGVGTRLGSGCTSGHGVCGIARLSPRSLTATLVFMATAAAVVFVVRHVLGG